MEQAGEVAAAVVLQAVPVQAAQALVVAATAGAATAGVVEARVLAVVAVVLQVLLMQVVEPVQGVRVQVRPVLGLVPARRAELALLQVALLPVLRLVPVQALRVEAVLLQAAHRVQGAREGAAQVEMQAPTVQTLGLQEKVRQPACRPAGCPTQHVSATAL